jgi:hypothetical protein
MTMKSIRTMIDLLAVSLCACAHAGATYAIVGLATSSSSPTFRSE